MSRQILKAFLLCTIFSAGASGEEVWFRGNVHVHTDESDGLSPAADVVEWYKSHGYDFLALTDHGLQSVTDELLAEFEVTGDFLLLRGVEVTDGVDGRPVHLNALGVQDVVEPQGGQSISDAIRRNRLAIEEAGGLAVLNHPNGLLRAALTAREIQDGAVGHFEVCCADFLGGSGHPSTDELWDSILTEGQLLYGIAADDAHDFGPDSRDPGSAWIMVRSVELTTPAVLNAIRNGDFYSTTGVIIEELQQEDRGLCLRLGNYEAYGFRTEFIGSGGRVLHTDESESPCFEASGSEDYIRARVFRSDGALAWTQPLIMDHKP